MGDTEVAPSRRPGLIVERVDDELLVYDTATDEVFRLAPTAAAVFAACDGGSNQSALAVAASARVGEPVTEAEVRDALAVLAERGLLVGAAGVSRREAMRRAALAGAGAVAAVPLVKSIVAPGPAAAASLVGCLANGEHCSEDNECCSDHCSVAGICTDNTIGGGVR